jgi:hypothetical protein
LKIISHRGFWREISEKNTEIAFERSFVNGYGTETDLRDLSGSLVIAHDMPVGTEMEFDNFLNLFEDASDDKSLTLALNIKADGLALLVKNILDLHSSVDCFVFDMATPDMRSYLDLNIPVFTRMSEVEKDPIWLSQSTGVWLDSFESDWYSAELVEDLLNQNKRVCIVSPELHSRGHLALWKKIHSLRDCKQLILCTDYPDLANKFFI